MSLHAIPDPSGQQSSRPYQLPSELHSLGPRMYPRLIGDAERAAACDLLSEHYSAGRLLVEEFDQRMESALNARTEADLARLLADLPATYYPDRTHRTAPPPQRRPPSGALVLLEVFIATISLGALLCLLGLVATSGYNPSMVIAELLAALGAATVVGGALYFSWRR